MTHNETVDEDHVRLYFEGCPWEGWIYRDHVEVHHPEFVKTFASISLASMLAPHLRDTAAVIPAAAELVEAWLERNEGTALSNPEVWKT